MDNTFFKYWLHFLHRGSKSFSAAIKEHFHYLNVPFPCRNDERGESVCTFIACTGSTLQQLPHKADITVFGCR